MVYTSSTVLAAIRDLPWNDPGEEEVTEAFLSELGPLTPRAFMRLTMCWTACFAQFMRDPVGDARRRPAWFAGHEYMEFVSMAFEPVLAWAHQTKRIDDGQQHELMAAFAAFAETMTAAIAGPDACGCTSCRDDWWRSTRFDT